MSIIDVHLDLEPFFRLQALPAAAIREVRKANADLAREAHGWVVDQASHRLHTRREMYVDGLDLREVNRDTWVLTLDAGVRWIDDGMPAHSMLDALLKSPKARTAKDGSKYLVVPFQHNKGPTQQTPAQRDLLSTVKQTFRQHKVPYGKIERDGKGNPRLGLLHEFDIPHSPVKTHHGPGQGHGPIGAVRQGPTGIPFLKGVRVYQKNVADPKTGRSSAKRFIMTFRVASTKQRGQGRWDMPAMEGVHIFEDAAKWATDHWRQKVAPALAEAISINLR